MFIYFLSLIKDRTKPSFSHWNTKECKNVGRGQKFDVMIAIQRQILRESLVFFSFHKFYIHPTAATNQFHKLATLMESHVLVWSTDIR